MRLRGSKSVFVTEVDATAYRRRRDEFRNIQESLRRVLDEPNGNIHLSLRDNDEALPTLARGSPGEDNLLLACGRSKYLTNRFKALCILIRPETRNKPAAFVKFVPRVYQYNLTIRC